jgi:hypothetical protein
LQQSGFSSCLYNRQCGKTILAGGTLMFLPADWIAN